MTDNLAKQIFELPYIKKFDQLCQEINDCQEFIVNYKSMSPEEFRQETEKLQYHKIECEKLCL